MINIGKDDGKSKIREAIWVKPLLKAPHLFPPTAFPAYVYFFSTILESVYLFLCQSVSDNDLSVSFSSKFTY